jgi:regulator of sigma E protease
LDFVSLIPSFGGVIWTVLAFVVALSIIVAVHEYGHYIVGRWSGIHAEVFSVGFGPVIYTRTDKRGTRWQVAALPLGGYVKFAGDADAASGRDAAAMAGLAETERRRTMHGAPLWARSATVAAGPAFNFVFSIAVFALFFLFQGVATDAPVVGQVKTLPALSDQLQPGDRILAIGGEETPDLATFFTVANALPPSAGVSYRLDRAGQEVTVDGPFPFPPVVDGVQPGSAAMDVGMAAGDVIVAVDGVPVQAFSELRTIIGASGGDPLLLSVWRPEGTQDMALVPRRMDIPLDDGGFETRWMAGLSGGLAFVPETRTPGPLEAVRLAAVQTWDIITGSLSGLWHMITGAISSCNLQGPIGIAETSGAAASMGIISFVWFIAMLSTAVGLMNLFPIPVLDGGHLVFHAWEAVTGRPPSDRALQLLMGTGLAALLALMAFALTNDLFCP